MMKWKIIMRDIAVTALVGIISLLIVLPITVNYLLNKNDKISAEVKENIAIAAKKFFMQETNRNLINIDELNRKGYINDLSLFESDQCNQEVSFVSLEKTDDGQYKFYVDLYCKDSISKLTLAY